MIKDSERRFKLFIIGYFNTLFLEKMLFLGGAYAFSVKNILAVSAGDITLKFPKLEMLITSYLIGDVIYKHIFGKNWSGLLSYLKKKKMEEGKI